MELSAQACILKLAAHDFPFRPTAFISCSWPIDNSFCLSVGLSVRPSIHPSIHLSIYLFQAPLILMDKYRIVSPGADGRRRNFPTWSVATLLSVMAGPQNKCIVVHKIQYIINSIFQSEDVGCGCYTYLWARGWEFSHQSREEFGRRMLQNALPKHQKSLRSHSKPKPYCGITKASSP